MELKEIRDKLNKTKEDRDKQQEKVDKLNETLTQIRNRLTKENAKLGQLNSKIDQQEFYILKERLSQYGLSGEDGIEDLLLIYEQYGNPKEDTED